MRVSPQPVPRAPDQASEIVDSEAGERAYHGTLKWFDVTRGFAFVVADALGVGDILIHFTVLQPHGRRSLHASERVECIARQSERGLPAGASVSNDSTVTFCHRQHLTDAPHHTEPSTADSEVFSKVGAKT